MNLSQRTISSLDELNLSIEEASLMSMVGSVMTALKRLRIRADDSMDDGKAVVVASGKQALIVVRPEAVEVYKGDDVTSLMSKDEYTARTPNGTMADVKKILKAIADSSLNVRQVLKQKADDFNAEALAKAL